MKLQHHIISTILAIAYASTSALPAAGIPHIKTPASIKAPPSVPHAITPPKVPVINVPAVPKIPNIPVVKTPVVPKVPVVKVPAIPKNPVVKVPVIPRVVSTPKVPMVKVPVAPKIAVTPKVPVVKVPATPKIPAIATQVRIPQTPKVPVSVKIPPVAQTRAFTSSKRSGKIPTAPVTTPVIKTVTPAKLLGASKPSINVQTVKAARLGQELKASGIVAEKKSFVADRVGQFSGVNAPRTQVPDSDSDAQEMAVIPPSNGSAGQNTDPATQAGEMGWTPWWAAGSTSSSEGSYSGSSPPPQADPYAMSTKGPRDPSKKKLLYAPNPVKK